MTVKYFILGFIHCRGKLRRFQSACRSLRSEALISVADGEIFHSASHNCSCRSLLRHLLLVILSLFFYKRMASRFEFEAQRSRLLYLGLILCLPFRYGFMFGRESARKELGDLIEDLRQSSGSGGDSSPHS